MLGLNELKQTRVYQKAREEGNIKAKLERVPLLQDKSPSLEEIAQR